MKIALIYLPHPYLVQPEAQAPLGLMYIAAVLQEKDIDVEICSFSSYLTHEAIAALPEADMYGITVTSMEIPQANRFAHLMRERFFDAKIVLGGPGTVAAEFVDWNVIDSICQGEGENAVLDMVKDFPDLKKIYAGAKIIHLDDVPFPARNLLKDKLGGNIFAYNKNYKPGGSTVILTGRGCPFNCGFCTAPMLRKINHGVRYRSPKNICDEIKQVVDLYNIRQFRFSDDMFTANRNRAMEIAEKIGELDVIWRISCRVKPFDEELANVLYNAGCVEMSFGVESFDNHVLKVLRKGTTVEDNVRALEICDKVGIKTRVLFMIRTPGQTRKTIQENIKWLNRIPFNIIACTSFVPIPGCDIWYHPEKYDVEILNRNLDDYNFYFFSSHGENKLKDVIKLKGRSLEAVNNETIEFREYLKSTGKINTG